MTKKANPNSGMPPNNSLTVRKADDECANLATARTILSFDYRHALVASQVLKTQFGDMDGAPGFGDYADAIHAQGDAAANGDLNSTSRALVAQAVTLDTIFTEMARRMALNMGENLAATETYARIALKAQAQSRATLEAHAKLHQPREQIVKHVHVNEGGQAVVADEFHHHIGGTQNAEIGKQVHGQGYCCPAMLGQDPSGNGMPISSNEREEALPTARRKIDRSA